jgi:hypothetical protein
MRLRKYSFLLPKRKKMLDWKQLFESKGQKQNLEESRWKK